MIIVSQNKKRIINFDTIQEIEINGPGTWGQSFYSIDTYPLGEGKDTHIRLGKYKTEKRAKEVLREIIVEYSKYMKLRGGPSFFNDSVIQPNIFNIPKVYEMPTK